MKGPDCAAISRQANCLHWGFSVPPSQMTDSASRLFVNAICYIHKFDGSQPLVRVSASPREWALRNAKLPELLSDRYQEMKSRHIRSELEVSPGLLPERYKGDIDAYIVDQLGWIQPEKDRVLPAALRDRFGNNENGWKDYYRQNLEYLRPGDVPGAFEVDSDVAGLKISNRDVKLLDHCIGLLESEQDIELADRVLQRYTGMTFPTAKEWRAWFNMHKGQMFFSDAGGYQFRIQPH